LRDISFTLYEGEILGFCGLVGAGRTEVMRSIFGAEPLDTGTIRVDGAPVRIRSVSDAISAGLAYLPEERKADGLFLDKSVRENLLAGNLARCSRTGMVKSEMLTQLADRTCRRLAVKCRDAYQDVGSLSGGNQQKVLLGRWMAAEPRVLIVDEPTRGVHIGAKGEVHRMLRDYAEAGHGVVVVSSELSEIIGLCDRIVVMREGRIAGELPANSASEEQLIRLAVGQEPS